MEFHTKVAFLVVQVILPAFRNLNSQLNSEFSEPEYWMFRLVEKYMYLCTIPKFYSKIVALTVGYCNLIVFNRNGLEIMGLYILH